MGKMRFYKTDDGRWYVDLPHWEGEQWELEMVSGADVMLDILSEGGDECEVYVSLDEMPTFNVLTLKEYPENESAGATYTFRDTQGHLKFDIWLCHVTTFVFGTYPQKIWVSNPSL